jgi:hypothetical protein
MLSFEGIVFEKLLHVAKVAARKRHNDFLCFLIAIDSMAR